MPILVICLIAVLVVCVAISAHNKRYGIGQKVTAKVTDSNTGKVIISGRGNSVGSSIVDSFSRVWNSVSISSSEDTIKSKLNAMSTMLNDSRDRMFDREIAECNRYICRMRDLLKQKEDEKKRKEQQRLEAERERKRQQQEKAAEAERKRREKEKALSVRQQYIAEQRRLVTASMRFEVLARDHYRCKICGATEADGVKLHVDHIYPLAKGGKTEMANLRTLCDRCNLGKGAKIVDEDHSPAANERVISLLMDAGVEFIDKSSVGGSIYFFSDSAAELLKKNGFDPKFAKNGAKSTEHRPAWYIACK